MNTNFSNYTLEHLPSTLRQAFEEKTVYAPSGEVLPLDSNISIDEALALYSAVRALQPDVSVEIGLAKGISTLAILQAIADNGKGVHHVVDPYQRCYQYAGLESVRRAGLESHFVFHETFTENVVPNLPQVQFGFIDGSHLFDLTLVEFVLIDKKLTTGGVIGLHDLWMPSIQKVASYILTNRAYAVVSSNAALPTIQKEAVKEPVSSASRSLSWLPRFKQIPDPPPAPLPDPLPAPQPFDPANDNIADLAIVDNLLLLQKLKDDNNGSARDWQFHEPF